MHGNGVLYFLAAVNYLLAEHAKSARPLNPLICVALYLLDGRALHMIWL